MKKPVTLLDGAVGTSLWEKAEAAGAKKNPVWTYNLEHPEFVRVLYTEYAEAGAEIILANTFGANGPAVQRASSYDTKTVVSTGVRLAKETLSGTGKKIALAAGPLSMLMEPYGDLEEDEVAEIYAEMFSAGMDAGADLICLQTFMDADMMRVAAGEAKKFGVPVFCTLSFEKRGKTMMGNSPADIVEQLEPLGIDAVGVNCSVGPELALPVLKAFAEATTLPLIFKPNAGLPTVTEDGTEPYTPEQFAVDVLPALEYASYLGGCCGTNPSFIRALSKILSKQP